MDIKIGTRGSKLALWQADHVGDKLRASNISYARSIINTRGDMVRDVPLNSIGEVGLFTKALDEALLSGVIDLAVHSAKDMPSVLPYGLEILACLRRADPRDVLLTLDKSVHPENLSRSWVIGTSSVRRRSLLTYFFDHFEVKDIRGNIDSRLGKLKSGAYDGIMLAAAGVKRMGFESYISHTFSLSPFTPPVGQGIIAVSCRSDFEHRELIRSALNHVPSELALMCERSFLKTLQGGCNTPVFGHAHVMGNQIMLEAGIAQLDGSGIIREKVEGDTSAPEALGSMLASSILQQYNS